MSLSLRLLGQRVPGTTVCFTMPWCCQPTLSQGSGFMGQQNEQDAKKERQHSASRSFISVQSPHANTEIQAQGLVPAARALTAMFEFEKHCHLQGCIDNGFAGLCSLSGGSHISAHNLHLTEFFPVLITPTWVRKGQLLLMLVLGSLLCCHRRQFYSSMG